MRVARSRLTSPVPLCRELPKSITSVVDPPRTIKSVTRKNKLKSLFDGVDRVNVTRLADERQSRDDEIKLHRELALQVIDLGYRALATRLHPDAGGSRDAMARLNTVRHELKEFAAIQEICMTAQLIKTSKALRSSTSTISQHLDAVERARELYLGQIKRAEAEYFERIKRATEIVTGENTAAAAEEPTPTITDPPTAS